jgi:hypothetical protein
MRLSKYHIFMACVCFSSASLSTVAMGPESTAESIDGSQCGISLASDQCISIMLEKVRREIQAKNFEAAILHLRPYLDILDRNPKLLILNYKPILVMSSFAMLGVDNKAAADDYQRKLVQIVRMYEVGEQLAESLLTSGKYFLSRARSIPSLWVYKGSDANALEREIFEQKQLLIESLLLTNEAIELQAVIFGKTDPRRVKGLVQKSEILESQNKKLKTKSEPLEEAVSILLKVNTAEANQKAVDLLVTLGDSNLAFEAHSYYLQAWKLQQSIEAGVCKYFCQPVLSNAPILQGEFFDPNDDLGSGNLQFGFAIMEITVNNMRGAAVSAKILDSNLDHGKLGKLRRYLTGSLRYRDSLGVGTTKLLTNTAGGTLARIRPIILDGKINETDVITIGLKLPFDSLVFEL